MKHLSIVGVLFGLVFLASFSCSKMNNCEESEWINIPFETLGNDTIIYWLEDIDEMKTNVFVVIKNQNDFQKYVRCNYAPLEIDFNSQILLVGLTKHHQCALLGEQNVIQKCKEVHFDVEVIEMDCMMPENVFYFALISAEYSGYKFRLNAIMGY